MQWNFVTQFLHYCYLTYKNENQQKHWLCTPPWGAAIERSFPVNDITELTGVLKWIIQTGSLPVWIAHFFVLTGKVIPVILCKFTGIAVWK